MGSLELGARSHCLIVMLLPSQDGPLKESELEADRAYSACPPMYPRLYAALTALLLHGLLSACPVPLRPASGQACSARLLTRADGVAVHDVQAQIDNQSAGVSNSASSVQSFAAWATLMRPCSRAPMIIRLLPPPLHPSHPPSRRAGQSEGKNGAAVGLATRNAATLLPSEQASGTGALA